MMKHTIEVRIELGSFSTSEPEGRLRSMYGELRGFCAKLDHEYGGTGYVTISIAHKNGEAITKEEKRR